MSETTDDLEFMVADALYDSRGYAGCPKEDTAETRNVWAACQTDAKAVVASLVQKHGEPTFEWRREVTVKMVDGTRQTLPVISRLTFNWVEGTS